MLLYKYRIVKMYLMLLQSIRILILVLISHMYRNFDFYKYILHITYIVIFYQSNVIGNK